LGKEFVEGFAGVRCLAGRHVEIAVVVEPEPAGTGRRCVPVDERRQLVRPGFARFRVRRG
jgi:hypothetical protein